MTLQELFELRNDSALRNRVAAACWNECKVIFTEAGSVTDHADRIKWAVYILRDSGTGGKVSEVFKAVLVVLTDPATATDADIQTAVGQIINKFATSGV